MVSPDLVVFGFIGGILLLGIIMALHARSIDSPLENEKYLAKNPELRELKQETEDPEAETTEKN